MEHHRTSGRGGSDRLLVSEISLYEADRGNVGEVLELAIGEVVERYNIVPLINEATAEV
jgi:hypothetical protein